VTILTVQFDINGYYHYDRLLEVFERSVRRHMPQAKVESIILPSEERTKDMHCGKWANTKKLRVWADYIEKAKDDIILADCDMIMVKSAEHAFGEPFDIAYTQKTKIGKVPFNNGIIMVRPTRAAKDFMWRWVEVNEQMYLDKAFHAEWNKKYKGMNQTAFGYLLETGDHNAQLHAYQTREWNAVNSDWAHIDEKTVFVHIKGELRTSVLAGRAPVGAALYPAALWYREAGMSLPNQYKRLVKVSHGRGSVISRKRVSRAKNAIPKVEAILNEMQEQPA